MEGKPGRPKEKKINDIKLMQMLRDNASLGECAKEFGVSLSAVKGAKIRINRKIESSPSRVDDDFTGNTIDSMGQLKDINQNIVAQLGRCNRLILHEEEKMKLYDEALAKGKEDNLSQEELRALMASFEAERMTTVKQVLAIQTNLIQVSGEVRKQIDLQLKIAETLYNIQMMQEFQSEIITLLKEVDQFVAQKLITKLKERRTIRGLVKLN